jgi:hypothetical protein
VKRIRAADLEGVCSTSRPPQPSKWSQMTERMGGAMVWRSRARQWLGAAIVIALAAGLFWVALKQVDTAALDAAMSEAARQRELVP